MRLFRERRPESTDRPQPVMGERPAPLIVRTLSLQTKLSNLAALGLALALGVAFLFWYYGHVMRGPSSARVRDSAAQARAAAGNVVLPTIGPVRPPPLMPSGVDSAQPARRGSEDPQPDASVTPRMTLLLADPPSTAGIAAAPALLATPRRARGPSAASAATLPTPDRRLSGDAFVAAGTSTSTSAGPPADRPEPSATPGVIPATAGVGVGAGELAPLLTRQEVPAASARLLPTASLLLPKGSFIDCTLETAIDSTLPGITGCITATDTFSADGRVVLLERGTKLIGETRGQVQQGAARVFVVWTEARTPEGVSVPLDSPAADELGRSGLAGVVERHFWQRFGAAVLISVIDGAIQAGVQSSAGRGGTMIYNPGGAQDVMSEVLRGSVAIRPTIIKNNGDRVQVLVARDVDFRPVYELHAAARSY